ncbi:MAG: DUF1330 domain-containing protein [Aeromicrobium sp.]|jgi:uncharacterized protein (DUF1330 family)
MAAYVVLHVTITDPVAYADYEVPATRATIDRAGGRILALDDHHVVVEGEIPEQRTVLLEFPDFEAAETWYHSEDYQRAVAIRSSASHGRMTLVHGWAG